MYVLGKYNDYDDFYELVYKSEGAFRLRPADSEDWDRDWKEWECLTFPTMAAAASFRDTNRSTRVWFGIDRRFRMRHLVIRRVAPSHGKEAEHE